MNHTQEFVLLLDFKLVDTWISNGAKVWKPGANSSTSYNASYEHPMWLKNLLKDNKLVFALQGGLLQKNWASKDFQIFDMD